MAFGGAWGQQAGLWVAGVPPVNPLPFALGTLTIYVDSVAGNDANPGTQALPFRTLPRAITFRKAYSTLYGNILCKLIGVGPYAMPNDAGMLLGGAALGGIFAIQGDPAAEVVHATGTFTGDFAGAVLPTSAGLGVDTQVGRFIRITSGNCAGVVVPVCTNTDTSVTPVSKRFRTQLGAVANGNTFSIISPGTVINPASMSDWGGGGALSTLNVFHGINFTATVAPTRSVVGFVNCLFSNGSTGMTPNFGSLVNLTPQSSLLAAVLGLTAGQMSSGGGIFTGSQTLNLTNRSSLFGNLVMTTGNGLVVTNQSYAELTGARLRQTSNTATRGGIIFLSGQATGEAIYRIDCQTFVNDDGEFYVGNAGTAYTLLQWALTSGNCFTVSRGGLLTFRNTGGVLATGGTTAAASCAIDCSLGGRCYFQGPPTLTGGTLNLDLKTTATAVAVANSVLAAAPSSVDALGSPYGDVLCRVS
jgi:hypothetical protein